MRWEFSTKDCNSITFYNSKWRGNVDDVDEEEREDAYHIYSCYIWLSWWRWLGSFCLIMMPGAWMPLLHVVEMVCTALSHSCTFFFKRMLDITYEGTDTDPSCMRPNMQSCRKTLMNQYPHHTVLATQSDRESHFQSKAACEAFCLLEKNVFRFDYYTTSYWQLWRFDQMLLTLQLGRSRPAICEHYHGSLIEMWHVLSRWNFELALSTSRLNQSARVVITNWS